MTPGFYTAEQVPMSLYLSDPCDEPSLSSGCAHTLLTRSPRHAYAEHPRLGGGVRDDSDASDIGSIAHDLLLGGEGRICVIEPSDYRSKPTKDNPEGSIPVGWTNASIRAARDEARANGLTPILAGAMAGARQMALAAQAFIAESEIAGVFTKGDSEVTQLWQEGDVWCRARHDYVNHEMRIRLSYKTTQASAAPEPFIRGIMSSMGYKTALAFYRRGFEALTERSNDWLDVILVQEQHAPYACSLIGLDPAAWALADEQVKRAIGIWRRCLRTDMWPAYGGRVAYAAPSAWELAAVEADRA